MVLALLGWRAVLAWRGGALPSRWVVTAILVLAAALTLWAERTLLGKEAGITLLVVLMSLKTLELRARRDALVVFFLGFFLVLTHFLYSQSLATALDVYKRQAQHLRNDVLEDLRLLTNYAMDSEPRLCLLPVSYTHLDVYKRQNVRCPSFAPTRRRSTSMRSSP